MKTKYINWGILGTAKICDAIIPCIKSLKYNLSGVATRNKLKNIKFFKKHKIKKIYESYNSLVNDEKINFIYVPLPNSLHFDWCKKVLQKKKNVLCEKPICLDTVSLDKLEKLSRKYNCIISEAMMYRHHKLTSKLQSIIKRKVIGDITNVESNFYRFTKFDKKNIRFNKKLGGGSLFDLGYYSISLINLIFNKKPKKVFGKIVKKKNVDLKFFGEIHYGNNKIGSFNSSFIDENNDITIITGKNGKIIVPSTFLRGEKKIIILKKNYKKTFYIKDKSHRYLREVKNIVDASVRNLKLVVSIRESKKNVYCMEKLMKSAKFNKFMKL